MATKTRPNPPTSMSSSALTPPKRNLAPMLIIVGVVVAIIAAAAIIAIVASGDSDGGTEAVAEQMNVTVTGTPLSPYSSSASFDAAIGQPAPTLLGAGFDSSPQAVRPGNGQPMLVVFLAHWCPACNEEVPHLVDWFDSGRVPENLEVIGVSTGVRVGAANYPPSRWLERRGWPWPVLADSTLSEAATAYGVTGYPTSVVVGSDGIVLDRVSGVLGQTAFESFVATALARDAAATG